LVSIKQRIRWKTILNALAPTNIAELRSLLGINYYGTFIPNLPTTIEPLTKCLQANKQFKWTKSCAKAFKKIKDVIVQDTVLIPFNPKLEIGLATDASPVGLGAVLYHTLPDGSERPIALASRTLTSTERKYSQIDREALAIVWSVKRFFVYLFGKPFTLFTDNKALSQIFHPDKSLPSLSTTRMLHYVLFLAAFDYKLKFCPSSANSNANFLSQFPLNNSSNILKKLMYMKYCIWRQ